MKNSKSAIVMSIIIEKIQFIAGIIFLLLFGLCTVVSFADAELASDGFLAFCLVVDGLCILLIYYSRKRHKLNTDFKKYVSALSDDPTGSILNLANAMGTSEDVISVNLNKMIEKKYFSNAYIDKRKNCIVLYNQGETMGVASTAGNVSSFTGASQGMVTVCCKGCGGVNAIPKGQSAECEYCGSLLQG